MDNRGHVTDPADFKQITPEQTSDEDVRAILGSPSAVSTFGPQTWYYISEQKETWGMFPSEVTEQNVTAIHFDENHKVTLVEDHSKEDGKNVTLVEKTTPAEGRHLNAVEQMLGNMGRFAAPGRSIDPRNLGH